MLFDCIVLVVCYELIVVVCFLFGLPVRRLHLLFAYCVIVFKVTLSCCCLLLLVCLCVKKTRGRQVVLDKRFPLINLRGTKGVPRKGV